MSTIAQIPAGASIGRLIKAWLTAPIDRPPPLQSQHTTILVAGAFRDGPWYDGFARGLRAAGHLTHFQSFQSGAPPCLFLFNVHNPHVHRKAERELANTILNWRRRFPTGQINLLAHSAGCGVALGATARLPQDISINNILLAGASVSPTYPLAPILPHLRGQLHVLVSPRESFMLGFWCRHFGAYEGPAPQAQASPASQTLIPSPTLFAKKSSTTITNPPGANSATTAPISARKSSNSSPPNSPPSSRLRPAHIAR